MVGQRSPLTLTLPEQGLSSHPMFTGIIGHDPRRRTTGMPPQGEEARGVTVVFAVLRRVRERWGKKPGRAVAQPQLGAVRPT